MRHLLLLIAHVIYLPNLQLLLVIIAKIDCFLQVRVIRWHLGGLHSPHLSPISWFPKRRLIVQVLRRRHAYHLYVISLASLRVLLES